MTGGLRGAACALLLVMGSLAQATDFCELPPCDSVPARTFSGKVIAVLDGDTLLVLRNGKPVKVRLVAVDAPEKAQPYGAASQASLAELVVNKQVRVASRAVDDYGRLVATVYANDLNVNHEQVRRGMAWEYSRFHSNREVMALQREAQQAGRGLWAEAGAIEPSQWRKQHPGRFTVQAPSTVTPAATPVLATPRNPACGDKKYCSEMISCEEARHYLTGCGIQTLDGNGDGVPCEKLCVPK